MEGWNRGRGWMGGWEDEKGRMMEMKNIRRR